MNKELQEQKNRLKNMKSINYEKALALAAYLDKDQFDLAVELFDSNCIYNSPSGVLVGPQNIISSYKEHTEYAHSTFDKVIYESSVKELSPNEFEITYKDIISKMAKTHIYQCKQIVLFNSKNLIEKITHQEISSEYENLLNFYREVGL